MPGYTLPPATRINVTKHAVDRLRQRFKFHFNQATLAHLELTKNLIAAQVSSGRVCDRWLQVPFYVNKVNSTYGPTIVVQRSGLFYLCNPNPKSGGLIVRTVVPHWFLEDPVATKRKV